MINKCGRKFMVCLLIEVVVWNIVMINFIIKLGIMIVDISMIIMNMVFLRIFINILGDISFFKYLY